MTQTIQEPQQQISLNAVKMWRMNAMIELVIGLVVLGGASVLPLSL